MLSRPVWPRGHSSTSVRASITAASEPSPSAIVSDSVSSTYHSQSRNSLPRKSRLALVRQPRPSPTASRPARTRAGPASSTPRVCRRASASRNICRPALSGSKPSPNVCSNSVCSRSITVTEVVPTSSSFDGASHSSGTGLAAQETAVGGFFFQALLGALRGPRAAGRRWGGRWGWPRPAPSARPRRRRAAGRPGSSGRRCECRSAACR